MLFRSKATTEIYTTYDTLSLHDALPIAAPRGPRGDRRCDRRDGARSPAEEQRPFRRLVRGAGDLLVHGPQIARMVRGCGEGHRMGEARRLGVTVSPRRICRAIATGSDGPFSARRILAPNDPHEAGAQEANRADPEQHANDGQITLWLAELGGYMGRKSLHPKSTNGNLLAETCSHMAAPTEIVRVW